ncbi:hypothetical protein CAPTEDRAFT_223411 [Capitella teleta]|uniref:ABC-2 type transporter transmembrane domain-containing protein n=1 Tax=Capitella teleta TaxID=283909 RepID=R7UH83_CAPTE|nr:hypothetical protein CAPTEDRAFT_223411 [Capitella teleta]|eukprot:ELU02632.1 hypothetical protein CAPTEDRAFT_223411 [Capitella teleta]
MPLSIVILGFNPDPYAYLLFSLGVSMMAMAAVGMGHMAAALLPNPQLCMTLAPLMLGIFLTFAGFLVREDTLLPIFLPLLYLSPYRYTYTGLLIVQWRDIDYISCTYSTDYEDWFDAYNATTSTSGCLTNGYEVLRDYGYNPGDVRFDFWVVVAFFFAVEIIGYLVLWRRGSQRRK